LALKYRYIHAPHRGKWGSEAWNAWIQPFNTVVREVNTIAMQEVQQAEQARDELEQKKSTSESKMFAAEEARVLSNLEAKRQAAAQYLPVAELAALSM